jgi:hypothetical protein
MGPLNLPGAIPAPPVSWMKRLFFGDDLNLVGAEVCLGAD